MSAEATGYVWKHSPYRGIQKLVHLAIADVVNDAHGNEFWMTTASLARKAGVARSTVSDTLKHMIEHGHLTRLESGKSDGKASLYRFEGGDRLAGTPAQEAGTGVTGSRAQNSSTNSSERGARHPKERRQHHKGDLDRPKCKICGGSGWREAARARPEDGITVVPCAHLAALDEDDGTRDRRADLE